MLVPWLVELFGDGDGLGDLEDDVTVLGTVIESEAGDQTRPEQLGVGWATYNKATARGKTVSEALQGRGKQGKGGRYASTARDATPITRELARQILTGQIPDPTGGATTFLEWQLQDKLHASGDPRYPRDSASIRAKWEAGGDVLVATIGRWWFFKGSGAKRKASGTTSAPAVLAGLAVVVGGAVLLRKMRAT